MRRGRDAGGVDLLHLVGVGQDVAELPGEPVDFVGRQFQPGEGGDPADVEVGVCLGIGTRMLASDRRRRSRRGRVGRPVAPVTRCGLAWVFGYGRLSGAVGPRALSVVLRITAPAADGDAVAYVAVAAAVEDLSRGCWPRANARANAPRRGAGRARPRPAVRRRASWRRPWPSSGCSGTCGARNAGAVVHPDDLTGGARPLARRTACSGTTGTSTAAGSSSTGPSVLASAPVALLPGPNVLAYYFIFRTVGHSCRCAAPQQGLSGVAWVPLRVAASHRSAPALRLRPRRAAPRVGPIAAALGLDGWRHSSRRWLAPERSLSGRPAGPRESGSRRYILAAAVTLAELAARIGLPGRR